MRSGYRPECDLMITKDKNHGRDMTHDGTVAA